MKGLSFYVNSIKFKALFLTILSIFSIGEAIENPSLYTADENQPSFSINIHESTTLSGHNLKILNLKVDNLLFSNIPTIVNTITQNHPDAACLQMMLPEDQMQNLDLLETQLQQHYENVHITIKEIAPNNIILLITNNLILQTIELQSSRSGYFMLILKDNDETLEPLYLPYFKNLKTCHPLPFDSASETLNEPCQKDPGPSCFTLTETYADYFCANNSGDNNESQWHNNIHAGGSIDDQGNQTLDARYGITYENDNGTSLKASVNGTIERDSNGEQKKSVGAEVDYNF